MKKLIVMLSLLIITAVIITAGCITPQETTPDATLKGDWITQKLIAYSSETGFTEQSGEGYEVLKITEQNGNLLKIEIPGADRTCYAAISDKNGKKIVTDTSYGTVYEMLNGNIISENKIIFASAGYNAETGEITAFFDLRIKDGTEIKQSENKYEKKSLLGSWTELRTYSFENGDYVMTEGDAVIEITEESGPVFIGTISTEGDETKTFAGVISSRDEASINALIVQNNGDIFNAKISEMLVSLWNVDGSEHLMYANGEFEPYTNGASSNIVWEPIDLSGTWISEKESVLNSKGYSVSNTELSAVINVKDVSYLLIEGSDGNKYRGRTNMTGSICLEGVSPDRTIFYHTDGYISDDGKMYTYTTSRVKESGSVTQVAERIYTRSASKASGLCS